MKINFGLKLWSTNADLIDQAIQLIDEKTFDYIELFVVPDSQISPFKIDIPYIIHIAHHGFGVNIGNSRIREYNLQKINESIRWADELDAKYLILHAGDGSMEHATQELCEIEDNRILIENMPKVGIDNEKMIGYSPEQIQQLIGYGNRGLCLDLGHAVKAALSLGADYKKYIDGFLRLEPKLFHLSDGMLFGEKDEHLSFGNGEYDLKFMLDCVKNSHSKLVTLETPRMMQGSLDEDISNISILKKLLSI